MICIRELNTLGLAFIIPVLILGLVIGSTFSLGMADSCWSLGGRFAEGAFPHEKKEDNSPFSSIIWDRTLNLTFSRAFPAL